MTGCEVLVGLARFTCVTRNPACLPPEHAPLLPYRKAVAEQESGFRPLPIRDEAAGESLFQATPVQVVQIATARDAAGHTLLRGAGVGLGAIAVGEALDNSNRTDHAPERGYPGGGGYIPGFGSSGGFRGGGW